MINLCWGIIFLGITAIINWLLGIYDKIGVERLVWDWKAFVKGIAKIVIIVASIIGLGIVWQYSRLDLSSAGLEPITLTTSMTIVYAYKAIKHLANIFKDYKSKNEIKDDTDILTIEGSVDKTTEESEDSING